MSKTYFMTGATGYLGSKILRRLIENGSNVYCLKRQTSNTYRIDDLESKIAWLDLENFHEESFFERNQVECIIHCATDYGRKTVDPIKTVEANLILPLKLLHYGASAGVSRFINTDTVLDKNIDSYSLSKGQFSEWLKKYSSRITAINVALQHFYGAGDDRTKFTTNIIQSFIRSEPRIKLTKGEQTRDFIYIDDVVEAFLTIDEKLVEFQKGYFPFEVGTGNPVQIKEFVLLVQKLMSNDTTKLDFGAIPYRPGEVMDVKTNISNLENLGWHPEFSLENGLAKTIQLERLA